MPIKISGKNMETGQALREHINARLAELLSKFYDGGFTGHVVMEHDGPNYAADVSLHLNSGINLQVHGTAPDVYPAFEQAAHRLEGRLRRYKERLKGRKSGHSANQQIPEATPVPYYVIEAPGLEEDDATQEFSPVIVAETTHNVRTQTVGEAVQDLDLSGAPAIVFRNAGSGAVNIVYRRRDGNIGWVDPSLIANAS